MLRMESRLASSQQARSTLHASSTNPMTGSRRPEGTPSAAEAATATHEGAQEKLGVGGLTQGTR